MNFVQRFRVAPGKRLKLNDCEPGLKDHGESHKKAVGETELLRKKLRELQELLYADRRFSLLICLQGMDTAGKDGTIHHVMGAMNPQGCRVVGFKQPSADEAAHDFLWRIHRAVPASGEVVVFNRSHYEDVLVVRVHNLVPETVWSGRYERINAFEQGLVEAGTHILKFYLHISKEEQLSRFKDRLDDPAKRWKISEADYAERKHWDEYTAAYEEALSRCSTEAAPWFVIPANRKWLRNLAVIRIVVEYLEGLGLRFPPPTVDLDQIRKEYHTAKQV